LKSNTNKEMLLSIVSKIFSIQSTESWRWNRNTKKILQLKKCLIFLKEMSLKIESLLMKF